MKLNSFHRTVVPAAIVGGCLAAACSSETISRALGNESTDLVAADPGAKGAAPSVIRASLRSTGGGQQQGSGPTVDARVTQVLSQMASALTNAQTIAFKAATTTEDVSSTLQKLQFDTSVRGVIQRPNLAFVEKTGAENVTLWFDGATATILDRTANTYFRVSVNGDIDALLAKLDDLDVETPFAGLFGSDLQKKLDEYVYQGDYYAQALLDDRQAHHLALRQENVDWQVWVDVETSLPKKAVITSKMLAGAPEHILQIKEIKLDVQVDKATFQADVKGAQEQQQGQQGQGQGQGQGTP